MFFLPETFFYFTGATIPLFHHSSPEADERSKIICDVITGAYSVGEVLCERIFSV